MELMTESKRPVFERSGWPAVGDEGLQVLVVEDDDADAFLIRTALSRNARVRETTIARDGMEALDWLDRNFVWPDVAIIDLQMPRKNGFSLLVELQCRPWASFPRIVLTSSLAKADNVRAILRGADCFLTKPDTIDELGWVLSNALARF